MHTYYIYKRTNFISTFNSLTDYQSCYYINISAVIGFSIFQDSSKFYAQIYHAKVTKLINVFLYTGQLENFPIILIQPFKIVTYFVSKIIKISQYLFQRCSVIQQFIQVVNYSRECNILSNPTSTTYPTSQAKHQVDFNIYVTKLVTMREIDCRWDRRDIAPGESHCPNRDAKFVARGNDEQA